MKLLTQTLPQVRQLLRQGGWFSPALILSVVALEFFGRQSANDFYDTVGAASLVLLMVLVAIRHKAAPVAWVDQCTKRVTQLSRFADGFKIEFGPDLRGTPPIPRRLPISVHLAIGALILWSAVAIALWHYLPNSWRSYAIQGSYSLYLVGMIGLWGLLFAGALGGIYFPFMLFNYFYPRTFAGPDEPKLSRPQLTFFATYLLSISLASWLLPLWLVPAFCGVVLLCVTALVVMPRAGGTQFIWRGAGSRRVYSVTTPQLLWITTTLLTLLLTATTVTAVGGRVLGRAGMESDMPITTMLGTAVGWLTPGLLASAGIFAFVLWKLNPARASRPSLHIAGDLAAAVQPQIKRLLYSWGWNVAFDPQPARDIEVRVRMVEDRLSQAKEFEPVWPLCVSLDDLKDGAVRDALNVATKSKSADYYCVAWKRFSDMPSDANLPEAAASGWLRIFGSCPV